jgi:hypothetical protein
MGGCISRDRSEYDPTASLVKGKSPVHGLIPSLRQLVKQKNVHFWSTPNRSGESYHLQLVPPFSIQGGNIQSTVMLFREKEQEGRGMLVFTGVCNQGYWYQVNVTQYGKIMHQMYVGCTKHAANPNDYAIEYELVLYQ